MLVMEVKGIWKRSFEKIDAENENICAVELNVATSKGLAGPKGLEEDPWQLNTNWNTTIDHGTCSKSGQPNRHNSA